MAVIDALFLIILAISALRCWIRGFISELLSMAALILGVLSAIFFFRQGAVLVRGWFMPEMKILPEVIAFIAILVVVYLIVKIVEAVLKRLIEGISLGGLDGFLGFVFGLVEGLVIICLILFIIYVQPFFDSASILEPSLFANMLIPFIFGNALEINITESLEGFNGV